MSTIGHPLADLTNFLAPYVTSRNKVARTLMAAQVGAGSSKASFLPGATPGLPTYEECIRWYAEAAGWGFSDAEMAWGDAFNIFKGSIIMQGIGARYAVRQASSEQAIEYGKAMRPFGEVAYNLVHEVQQKLGEKSRL